MIHLEPARMIGNRFLVLLLGSIFFNQILHAQVLTRTVSRFDSLHNLTYEMTLRERPPLSDKISSDTLMASFVLSKNRESFSIAGNKTREVYDGNKLISMDLPTTAYRIANSINNSIFRRKSLPYIIGEIRKDLKGNATIKWKQDSIIDGKACFHLVITNRDTVVKNQHTYLTREILLDQKSYLPIYYRMEQQGFIDGTTMLVNTFSEIHCYNYQLNGNDVAVLSGFVIPPEFSMEVSPNSKPLLAAGNKAPALNLTDKDGNLFRLESQTGKVVLLNFTTNSCPHGVESIAMLNDLYSKYGKENFNIITINPFDDKESIAAYNRRGAIHYPIFLSSGTQNPDKYNVVNYPTFYLIDKNGNIVNGFCGYDENLSKILNDLIKENL